MLHENDRMITRCWQVPGVKADAFFSAVETMPCKTWRKICQLQISRSGDCLATKWKTTLQNKTRIYCQRKQPWLNNELWRSASREKRTYVRKNRGQFAQTCVSRKGIIWEENRVEFGVRTNRSETQETTEKKAREIFAARCSTCVAAMQSLWKARLWYSLWGEFLRGL